MTEKVIIFHNPRCSKSRACLELITSMGITPRVKLYLDEIITNDELNNILRMLGIKPRELLRKSEEEYETYNLDDNKLEDEEIIKIIIENPILIQRPLVIANNSAIIGRPPENIFKLLNKQNGVNCE
jgi:arsenate reductase|tara:strand:- start:1066 stop:1446 length:381 start_codon:yes stop_codon:yes gene_type:complete